MQHKLIRAKGIGLMLLGTQLMGCDVGKGVLSHIQRTLSRGDTQQAAPQASPLQPRPGDTPPDVPSPSALTSAEPSPEPDTSPEAAPPTSVATPNGTATNSAASLAARPSNPGSVAPRATQALPSAAPDTGPKQRAVVIVGTTSVTGGTIANATRVVAGMRAGYRACYNRILQSEPKSLGNLLLKASINQQGAVQAVGTSASGKLPPSLVSCVKARTMAARFAEPSTGQAVVQIPLRFLLTTVN